jgi:hypothetical protein
LYWSAVQDVAGGLGELGQAGLVHRVVHERAAALGDHEADVTEDLEVMRDGRLLERKVRDDIADADRFLALGKQVQDPDPGRIG